MHGWGCDGVAPADDRAGHPYLGQRMTRAKKAMTRTMMMTRQLQYGPQPSIRLCHLSLNSRSVLMEVKEKPAGRRALVS